MTSACTDTVAIRRRSQGCYSAKTTCQRHECGTSKVLKSDPVLEGGAGALCCKFCKSGLWRVTSVCLLSPSAPRVGG